MKVFSLTSARFQGEIIFTFGDSQALDAFEIQAELSPVQRTFFYQNLPVTIPELISMTKSKGSTMTVTEIDPDLSFERFYRLYNYKVGKKEAEKAWERLNKANKVKAMAAIRKYDQWLSRNTVAKLYPATYLNQERFNDELR